MALTTLNSHMLSQLDAHLLIPSVSLADKNWFKTGGPAAFFANQTML